jgi:uncharacterized membrane protein YsdA (DUF1294 family)
VVNLIGFIICKIDKTRAKKHQWRIAEKQFFIVSALGGAIGTYIGLRYFRHKTKHWYFMIGIPVIFIIQIMLGVVCYRKIFF